MSWASNKEHIAIKDSTNRSIMKYTLPFLLTVGAQAAGLSKEDFASILSSEADNEMEHMTTQSIEDTWSTGAYCTVAYMF